MLTKYINAAGDIKEAELTVEQVEALKEKGIKVLDAMDFDLPEVEAKKSTKVRLHVSESACVDCE